MRYYEIMERDERKLAAKLRALIDSPSTDPARRALAQRKLDVLLAQEEPAILPNGFKPIYSPGRFKADPRFSSTPSRFKAKPF